MSVSTFTTVPISFVIYQDLWGFGSAYKLPTEKRIFKTISYSFFFTKSGENEKREICPECTGTEFRYDTSVGTKVCITCGLVIETDETEEKYQSGRSEADHTEVFSNVYKRKSIRMDDILNSYDQSTFRRILKRDGYYDSDERRRNEVEKIFTRIKNGLGIQKYVIERAWKHYRNLENSNIFVGKRMFSICAALVYISHLQFGIPIQMQDFVFRINEHVGEITKSELHRAKAHVISCANEIGYDIGENTKMDSIGMLHAIINALRAKYKKEERYLSVLTIESKKMFKSAKKFLRYYGSLSSSVPSIIYYVAKSHSIPLTYNELKEASLASPQSIRRKYRILVKVYGNPKSRWKGKCRKK